MSSYLEYNQYYVPSGPGKIFYLDWALVVLICAVTGLGIMQLYSVAGGDWHPWAGPQMKRFGVGLAVMFIVAMIPIQFWQRVAIVLFAGSVGLLVGVAFLGVSVNGAQRWLDLGFVRLQPSELTKLTLVMALAAYYDRLAPARVSRPVWMLVPIGLILVPAGLTLNQPDLGTALLLVMGGGAVMFLAGVHRGYFITLIVAGVGIGAAVMHSKGTDWQLLKDYQYRRIETFVNPQGDPLGAGYHITQSKIALGSGGWSGRGYMRGTQSRLNFLPEKHTDFIFTTLAEELGFVGGMYLLGLYALILGWCVMLGLRARDRFCSLLIQGIGVVFFLFVAVNMGMVMGLAPVVGVPLPLVSYGGSAMLILMLAFGLVQSAHVHRPRRRGG